MFYYLQDHITKCILAISEDVYLLTNLRSGFIDSYLRITENAEAANFIKHHLTNNTELGVTIDFNKPKAVSLTSFDTVKEKMKLVRIRKPCFEELLVCQRKYILSNAVGFNKGDEFYIYHALSNPRALEEYAEVLGTSAEFARKELTLISESVFKDNFRAFTIASMLKNKINQVVNEDQAVEMINDIQKTFSLSGIYGL